MPDPLFVCHLYAVLALIELYSNCKTNSNTDQIPGTSFYPQTVALLQDLYEGPSVEQVQILSLLSFYASALGRLKTAHVYCGIGLRLSIGLGLHRSLAGAGKWSAVQRESRRRVFWTLYLFGRLISSELGYPLGIRDSDIDVELPSMDGLTSRERAELADPKHLRAHAQLAKIIGDILSDMYCARASLEASLAAPEHESRRSSAQRIHHSLNALRQWERYLSGALRMPESSTDRSLFTLHLQYHLCIIQTTRSILLHVFNIHSADKESSSKGQAHTVFQIMQALADACVQSAQTMHSLLSRLFEQGTLAVFGYFDAHYLFASTLILLISNALACKPLASDAVSTSFTILKAVAESGNISARDYACRLDDTQSGLSSCYTVLDPIRCLTAYHALLSTATTSAGSQAVFQAEPLHVEVSSSTAYDSLSGVNAYLTTDPLDNPFIDSFLAGEVLQWPIGSASEAGLLQRYTLA